MEIVNFKLNNVVVVIIIDPINLQGISIDALKEKGYAQIVVDPNAIIFKNSKGLESGLIQSVRLEFNSGGVKTFESKKFISFIMRALNVIPKLSSKFLGINYFANTNIRNENNAGNYIKLNLLANGPKLEEKLNAPVISAATRIIFGKQDDFLDIRLFPPKLEDPNLGIQFHSHKKITERKDIKEELERRLNSELDVFLNKLSVL